MAKTKKENLIARVLAGVFLIWAGTLLSVMSWVSRPTHEPKINEAAVHMAAINSAAQRKEPIGKVLDLRASLIRTYLDNNDEVNARKELTIYKDQLQAHPELPLLEKVRLRDQLATIYMAFRDFELAIREYDENMRAFDAKELAGTLTDEDSVAYARDFNNRGVAHFFWAANLPNDDMKKSHLEIASTDFQRSKKRLEEINQTVENSKPSVSQGKTTIAKVLRDNQSAFELEMVFTPPQARP